jgi:hypothetical protein
MKRHAWVVMVALVAAGCLGEEVLDPSGAVALDGKADGAGSDRASEHLRAESRLVGALAVGATRVAYTGEPRYLVYELQAQRGDDLVIEATSTDGGDPSLWLLDADYAILEKNDDAYSSSTDSEILYRIEQTGRYLVAIAEVYGDPATFEISLRGASAPDADDLAAFLALSADQKMDVLYENRAYSDTLDLNAGFSRVPNFVLRDELEGTLRSTMLDAYFALRDEARAQNGTVPAVSAIYKGGLLYAIEMDTAENGEDSEWAYVRVFDAAGARIGEHGQLGF